MNSKRIAMLVALVCLALTALFASSAALAQSGTISLTVDATRTPQKFIPCTEQIPVKPGPLTLYYPKWIPGEHSPSGPIAGLTGLKFSANGQTIPWRRDLTDVFTFHLEIPSGVDRLEAKFDYLEPSGGGMYGGSLSATDKLIVLEWNQTILYPAGTPADKIMVAPRLILPDGWKFGTPQKIEGQSGDETTFATISLEELVDSPVIAGEYYRAIDITPPGEKIHHEIDLAADDAADLNMSPEVEKGLKNLVAEAGALFGSRHYRDYHFLLALSDHVAHFGLEHHECNDSRLPERILLEPNAAVAVGGLLAHEYAHSWNGKFRRPADLSTPDYEVPMKTDLLWVYEGLTDYLGPLLAARSGLWTPEQYHEYLASIAADLGPGTPGRTWRDLQDTATAIPGVRGGRAWGNWKRGSDYYPEGDLVWLEVATIIHQQSNGAKSIDDFCHLFHGGANNGPELKTYTFDQVVEALNQIAPYDWAKFLHERLTSLSPDAPTGGIENGGWKVEFSSKPPDPGLRGGNPGDAFSIGLRLDGDGTVGDSIVGGPAFKAGITAGMKIAGVNGRVFTRDVLDDAIKAGKDNSEPIKLLVIDEDYYKTVTVDYHGGERYPHLVRVESKPDYLDDLIKPRAGGQ